MSSEEKTEVVKVKEIQNGITRPAEGTVTRAVWDIADRESAKLGKPASRKIVIDAFMNDIAGANQATAATQYARWVKFWGLSEQLKEDRAAEKAKKEQAGAAEKAEAAEKRAAEKAAKDAEREQKKAEREAERQRRADEKEAERQRKQAEREAAKVAKDAETETAA